MPRPGRRLCFLGGLLAVGTALAGCGGQRDPSPAGGKPSASGFTGAPSPAASARDASAPPASPSPRLARYIDPQGRFRFSYPVAFGRTSRGTDSGFQETAVALKFSDFSWGARRGTTVYDGEAVLTRGNIVVRTALGGLYDPILLQVLRPADESTVKVALPPPTPENFCAELAEQRHLDPHRKLPLDARTRKVVPRLDEMNNVDPRVDRCSVQGDTVVFDKEAGYGDPAAPQRMHVYGAVRFLSGPFSSFQLIRVTRQRPSASLLASIEGVVTSFRSS